MAYTNNAQHKDIYKAIYPYAMESGVEKSETACSAGPVLLSETLSQRAGPPNLPAVQSKGRREIPLDYRESLAILKAEIAAKKAGKKEHG